MIANQPKFGNSGKTIGCYRMAPDDVARPKRLDSLARSQFWTGDRKQMVGARELFCDEAGSRFGDLEAEPSVFETETNAFRRGFPKRDRRFISQKASITGRAFARNELPAKSPLSLHPRSAALRRQQTSPIAPWWEGPSLVRNP